MNHHTMYRSDDDVKTTEPERHEDIMTPSQKRRDAQRELLRKAIRSVLALHDDELRACVEAIMRVL